MMRLDDVSCAQQVPVSHRTESLYLPGKKIFAEMSNEQLKRGLCMKSRGDWHTCTKCQTGCQCGRLLAARMEGRVEEPEEPAEEFKPPLVLEMGRTDANAGRKRDENPRVDAALVRRLEKAVQRYVRTMQRIAGGEDVDKACAAEGYQHAKSLYGFRRKHKEACAAALAAAGVPNTDIRRRKRGSWTE